MRRSLPGDADYQPPHRPLSVFTCLSHCRLACFTSHGHEPPTSRSTSSGPAPCLPPSRALRAEPPPHAPGTGCAARPAVAPQPLPPSVAWRFTAKGWGGRAHSTRGGHTRLRSQDRDGVPRSPRRRGPKAEAFFSARSEPRPSPQGEQLSKLYELKHVRAERIEESPAQRGRQTPQMKSEAAEPGSVKC